MLLGGYLKIFFQEMNEVKKIILPLHRLNEKDS